MKKQQSTTRKRVQAQKRKLGITKAEQVAPWTLARRKERAKRRKIERRSRRVN